MLDNFSRAQINMKHKSRFANSKTFDDSANGYVRGEGCGVVK